MRRRLIFITLLMTLSLVATGCFGFLSGNKEVAVSGTVTVDGDVPGDVKVEVVVEGSSTKADVGKDGKFTLQLVPGEYKLTARGEGLESATESIVVEKNKPLTGVTINVTTVEDPEPEPEPEPDPIGFKVLNDVEGEGLEGMPIPDSIAGTVVEGEGIKGLDLTRGSTLSPSKLQNGFSAQDWDTGNNDRAGAIANDKYFQLGIEVEEGYKANLQEIGMSLRRSATNGPMNFELQVSLDDFATPGITVAEFTYRGRVSGNAPTPDPTEEDPYYYMDNDLAGRPNKIDSPGDPIPPIDLTGIEQLQDIAGGTVVTFRLYAWGNEKTTNTNSVAMGRMDGPYIKGEVIPPAK